MNEYLLPHGILPRYISITIRAPGLIVLLMPILAKSINTLFENPILLPAIWILRAFYLLILSGLFSVIYAVMYRMVAPPKYGATDAPPPKVKLKKYKR